MYNTKGGLRLLAKEHYATMQTIAPSDIQVYDIILFYQIHALFCAAERLQTE